MTPGQNVQVKRLVPLAAKGAFTFSVFKPWGRWEGNLRQPLLRWRGLLLGVVVLCSAHFYRAPGQAIPAAQLPWDNAVFGTFTYVKPTFIVVGDDAVWGISAGTYIQSPRVFGLELRGSGLRSGGVQQQEGILLGPRAVWHVGRYSPYTSAFAGLTNSWEWRVPELRPRFGLRERAAPSLTIVGGIDFYTAHHFSLRLGEISYARLHRRDKDQNSVGFSVGAVYRLPWVGLSLRSPRAAAVSNDSSGVSLDETVTDHKGSYSQ